MLPMKKLCVFLICLMALVKVYPQSGTADLGLFAGVATPFVDYTKTNRFQSLGFDYGGYYRYNFTSRMAVRINGLYGGVRGSGKLNGEDAGSFKKNVFEVSVLFEINYLDFMLGVEHKKFSPVVFTGVGLAYYVDGNSQPVVTPSIPIGVGVKYALSKKWGISAEFSMHKLFDDALDNIDDPYHNTGMESVTDTWHNNDWIGYLGISVMYRIYNGKKACPAYESLN
jgi:hypothetical protein